MRLRLIPVTVFTLALVIACGGGGKAKKAEEAAPAPEPTTTTRTERGGGSLSFGKPVGWQQTKETFEENGDKGVVIALTGPSASVTLAIHPKGKAPGPAAEIAAFQQGLSAELGDAVVYGEPTLATRELAGTTVIGRALPFTLALSDGQVNALHSSWVVDGPTTSALVVTDVPDTSAPEAEAEIEEVLRTLQVP